MLKKLLRKIFPASNSGALSPREINEQRLRDILSSVYADKLTLSEPGPMPPNELIAATALMNKEDIKHRAVEDVYFSEGYGTAASYLTLADKHGFDFSRLKNVYELGCGTARLIRHYRSIPNVRLIASDVRSETIEWCKHSLPSIEFHKNELEPPLHFISDGEIDFAIAQSVFTHIPLNWQQSWLAEMKRIMRPGGLFFCTVIGQNHIKQMLDEDHIQELEAKGELELDSKSSLSSYSTQLIGSWDIFQTENVVKAEFGRYFEIAEYVKNKGGGLDLLILRA